MNEQNPGSLEETATPPTLVDGCGCAPTVTQPTKPIGAVEAATTAPGMSSPAPPTMAHPSLARRSYKIVLSLEAATHGTFQAILAVGSADCDPRFTAFDVPDLLAALAAIPKLVSDAESAWNLQPRYPIARPTAMPKATDKAPSPTDASEPESPAQPSSPPAKSATSSETTKSSSGQLPLFG